MKITDWYVIVSLTMPSTWVAVLLALILTSLTLLLQFNKQVASHFVDAAIAFILLWKFSVIVTDFNAVVHEPFSLLYFNGGYVGVVIGTLGALISLIRAKVSVSIIQLMAVYSVSYYLFFMVVLNSNPILIELVTLITLVIVFVLLWKKATVRILPIGLLFFIAYFQPLGVFQTYTVWMFSVLLVLYSYQVFRNQKVGMTS